MRVWLVLLSVCVGVSLVGATQPMPVTVPPTLFLEPKWSKMFKYYDLQKPRDSKLSQGDFTWMEIHLGEEDNFRGVAEQVADLSYEYLAKPAIDELKESNPESTSITENEMVDFLKRKMLSGDLQELVAGYHSQLVELLSPSTADLTRAQFLLFELALGRMTDTIANRAFDAIAGDGQSSVSKAQYAEVYTRYMTDNGAAASVEMLPLYEVKPE